MAQANPEKKRKDDTECTPAERYIRNQQRRVAVNYKTDDFNSYIEPVIAQLDIPVAAFYKKCVFYAIKEEVTAHPRKYDKKIVEYYKTHEFQLKQYEDKQAVYGIIEEIKNKKKEK